VENEISSFDIAEYLTSQEEIAEFLTACLEEGDTKTLLCALRHAARARGMSDVAKAAGLGRESLYKALAPDAKPRAETLFKVITALGLRLETHPIKTAS
jgi:probable addiction module antidote protein